MPTDPYQRALSPLLLLPDVDPFRLPVQRALLLRLVPPVLLVR
jgi:hypothetical protein